MSKTYTRNPNDINGLEEAKKRKKRSHGLREVHFAFDGQNPKCLACQLKCKQSSCVKIIHCPQYKKVEEDDE